MRVLLVRNGNSYIDRFSYSSRILFKFFAISRYRPYGLCVLARKLNDAGHTCDILDLANFMKNSREGIMKKFALHYDMIGFSFFTNGYLEALRMAQLCKKINPNLKIIFGGPHASFQYYEILTNYDFVDYVGLGEGEKLIVDLANQRDFSEIRGFAYRENGKIKSNPPETIEIDSLEPIDVLENVKIFKSSIAPYKGTYFLETSRGCPVGCFFCANKGFFRQMRYRDAKKVVKDMKTLMDRGVKNIFLTDSNFSVNFEHVEKICKEMMKQNVSFKKLYAYLNIDFTTKDMLRIMKDAGFTDVFFGVESLHPPTLKKINKTKDPERYVKKVYEILNYAKEIGISASAAFMVPLPEQDRKSTFNEIKILKNIADSVYLSFLTPYPGTIYWMLNKDKVRIEDTPFFGGTFPIFYLSDAPFDYYKATYNLVYPLSQRVKNLIKSIVPLYFATIF